MLLCSNLLSLLFVMVSAVFTVGVCVCVRVCCAILCTVVASSCYVRRGAASCWPVIST